MLAWTCYAAFLYSGPAINVLAIILSARILGVEIGIARAVGAILFSVVIGVANALSFFERREGKGKESSQTAHRRNKARTLAGCSVFLQHGSHTVFANFGKPVEQSGTWFVLWRINGG